MPITESEMSALREMFLDVAGSLLESERKLVREIVAPMEGQVGVVKALLVEVATRFDRLEQRMGQVEQRLGSVESQVSQLVRLDGLERRLDELEASLRPGD